MRKEGLIRDTSVELLFLFYSSHLRVTFAINFACLLLYFFLCVELQNTNECHNIIKFEGAKVVIVELNQALLRFRFRREP